VQFVNRGFTRAVAVAAAAVVAFAGCSSSSPSPTGAATASAPPASAAPVTAAPSAAPAETVQLTLGSWRTEDLAMWQDEILPAFTAKYPNIKVEFRPTNTNEYNAAIQSQIEGGTGPDLITCRPYDVNRSWIEKGFFENLDGSKALDAFDPQALDAWRGADNAPYCVPVAAVLAGFYYNQDIFAELGLQVPTTQDEFLAVLQKVKDSGKYEALALGSAESWQLAYNGWYNIGPNYWKGEDGRLGLIDGTKKATDPEFVASLAAFNAWKPFLPNGQESLKYADMAQLFALGKAAIIPDGSWDINQLAANGVKVGVFGPPVAKTGDQRFLQEMPDMAIGINKASTHKDAAKTFLEWIASNDFLSVYVNKVPGFFAMTKSPVTYTNPTAQAFADLKNGAKLTPRLGLDRLSSGTPPFDDEAWRLLQVMFTTNTMSPDQVAKELQAGLESWYAPQMKK
jgi:raffinose/stachyose/melibiose transport system substrate-binding protein